MEIPSGHNSTRMKKSIPEHHLKSPILVPWIMQYLSQANTRAGLHLKMQYHQNPVVCLHPEQQAHKMFPDPPMCVRSSFVIQAIIHSERVHPPVYPTAFSLNGLCRVGNALPRRNYGPESFLYHPRGQHSLIKEYASRHQTAAGCSGAGGWSTRGSGWSGVSPRQLFLRPVKSRRWRKKRQNNLFLVPTCSFICFQDPPGETICLMNKKILIVDPALKKNRFRIDRTWIWESR